MVLTKRQVLNRLCVLTTDVMAQRHDFGIPADCFCGAVEPIGGFKFDDTILEFIETVVRKALQEKVDAI